MVMWVWVIGVVAVAWPILLAFYLDHFWGDRINEIGANSENARLAALREQTLRSDLEKAYDVLEQHEALIAALWQRTLGFHCEDSFSESDLPKYLGVKPNWQGFTPEFAGPVAYLVRYEPFPWGASAENLYFDRPAN